MKDDHLIPAPSAIRDELEKLVLADLHGPAGGPDEELHEASVSDRYLVGMVAPKRNPAAHEPAVDWPITKEDALDSQRVIPFLHRQLDKAVFVKR